MQGQLDRPLLIRTLVLTRHLLSFDQAPLNCPNHLLVSGMIGQLQVQDRHNGLRIGEKLRCLLRRDRRDLPSCWPRICPRIQTNRLGNHGSRGLAQKLIGAEVADRELEPRPDPIAFLMPIVVPRYTSNLQHVQVTVDRLLRDIPVPQPNPSR